MTKTSGSEKPTLEANFTDVKKLTDLSRKFRQWIIEMLTEAKSGHPGGSLSAIDIVTTLWFSEMQGIKDAQSLSEDRDRFVLSKGHAVPALYCALAEKGFIQPSELNTLRKTGSRLQGHPDRVRLPIVEASTGSLGQGMSVAQGLAIAAKMDSKKSRIYCLVGDGEIQEGQIWECALSAPKFKLSNLCVILDYNNGQIDGPVSEVMPIEPIADKWKAFGWDVITVDGHNFNELQKAFFEGRKRASEGSEKPLFVIAKTVKGKGVSFMENKIEWHGVTPKPEEAKRAIEEILKNG